MKRILALLAAVMMMVSCCTALADSEPTGVEDGVFTIAMECAYAPYNWTQTDDSNGAVPIKDSSDYANGYDVLPRRYARPTAGSSKYCAPTGIRWCLRFRPA